MKSKTTEGKGIKLTGNWKSLARMTNVDEMFDLVCFENYIRGKFNTNIPVDESRKVFERIKKLLFNHPTHH